MSRSQQKKEMKKKQLEENTKQVQTITRQLQRVGGASATFEQLDQDLKKAVRIFGQLYKNIWPAIHVDCVTD